MDHLLTARSIMAFSLGFHIIFAAVGMTMPFFMATSHYLYLRHGKKEDLALTQMWSKGVAILFAVGAVSGTTLSFELGLLWPNFMKYAGPIIGMPFSWEGTAFFLEAIFLGLFLYGWKKMPHWAHWLSGLMVGVFGFASGIFILSANSWMNSPSGFDWVNGAATNIDPVKAMFNQAWLHQTIHMQLAALQAVGLAVAGIHAILLLKNRHRDLNLKAMKISLFFGAVAALLQPLSGHFAAQRVAELQPAKLAALESHFKTEKNVAIIIGGIPNMETQEVDYAIKIPGVLSFLAFNDFNAEVKGLDQFPRDEWPPVLIVHIAFQIMVGLGTWMAALSALIFFLWWKGRLAKPWLLKLIAITAPLGFIALEAGWVVTEVGRQPWVIYGILKTKDAVTDFPALQFHFWLFGILYLILSFTAVWLLYRQVKVANAFMEEK
jgi:cytochrome d ubiquinol oxidase subunit I